ncbi:hypothetical protein H9I48_04180 [Wolbachia pipientis]|uniref:hypothetical protein n=1 Tax=Wolbachia pipientis TaxID=955 RepID=UPI0016514669|nr:hypothetical protein [Wolbachia pipientis]MBC6686416.1 hypothetical protein [Wolbachia pipientis]
MLVKNLSCPNQKNTNYMYRLPFNTCCTINKCGKDHKCEIDDKTKNELKENIKIELEKDHKCEIDDKTKNELKENIKNELKKNIKSELEKDHKCEIDDKTKEEIKNKIKDEIDCKCDQNKTSNEEKDKGKGEVDDGSKGAIESMLITDKHATDKDNCLSYAGYYKSRGEVGQPGWVTKDLLKQFLPDLMSNKEIVDHFYTKNTKQYHADNFAITFESKENTKCGSNINFTWAAPSNMWCNKGGKTGDAGLRCPEDFQSDKTSVCCPSTAPYADYIYSKNFFLNDRCPNLVLNLKGKELEECAGKTIVAKLKSPLIILDYSNKIIDKDGNNTGIYYYQLKPHLNRDGTMKDCGSNAKCQEYAKIIDKILWTSNKEVTLKIPDNSVEKRSYSPSVDNNQDETFSYHDSDNILI